MNALFLALSYLRFHWARSAVLVAVAAVILSVPVIAQVLLSGSQQVLTQRADSTPLVLGARGSGLDLAMNALYFSTEPTAPITMAQADTVWDTGLGLPIPLNTTFDTNGARIVGTSLEYFDFRGLQLSEGRQIALLGEAVLGAGAAQRLGLAVGDSLISRPQNLFDLGGVYPLEMGIVGVLEPTGTADDDAVFVDIKTTWVIAGIGHGHEAVLERDASAGDIVAAASIVQFNRITPENIDSFHFHGDPAGYPVTAIIVVPDDARAATILRGRYLDPDTPVQAIVPSTVIAELVERIFRIKALLDAVTLIVGGAAFAAVGLAIFLSYRLRAREMLTAFKIGARRGMILRLIMAETAILLAVASCLALAIAYGVHNNGAALVAWLLTP